MAVGSTEDESGVIDPADTGRTPEEEYEHQFALQFVHSVLDCLEQEYRKKGKEGQFNGLSPLLLDKKGEQSYAALAQSLGMTTSAITTEVWRLRKRFREIFDRELLKLIGSPAELAAEKQFLFASLSK